MCPLKYALQKRTICDNCKTNYGFLLKCCFRCSNNNETNENCNGDVINIKINQDEEKKSFKAIILDCARCNFIDESGAKCLKEIVNKYDKENVKVFLSNCNGNKTLFSKD